MDIKYIEYIFNTKLVLNCMVGSKVTAIRSGRLAELLIFNSGEVSLILWGGFVIVGAMLYNFTFCFSGWSEKYIQTK